jgi:hypothetical protein
MSTLDYTFSRPTTLAFTDRFGASQTAPIDVLPSDFNPDGSFRGGKWTDDSAGSATGVYTYLGENTGTIEIKFELTTGQDLFFGDLYTLLPSGISTVRFTYTTTEQKLYLNGVLVDSATGSFTWDDFDDIIELGNISGLEAGNGIWFISTRLNINAEGA